jgi:hypothetical protein
LGCDLGFEDACHKEMVVVHIGDEISVLQRILFIFSWEVDVS